MAGFWEGLERVRASFVKVLKGFGRAGESLGRFWKEFLQCVAWVPLTWPGGMRASDPPPTEGGAGRARP